MLYYYTVYWYYYYYYCYYHTTTVRPTVSLSIPYELLTHKQKGRENPKLVFRGAARSKRCAKFHFKVKVAQCTGEHV